MTKSLEQLALRKELLQARSALYRLKILHELHVIGGNLDWVHGGMAVATSLPVRSILFGLALQRVGYDRVARLLAVASRVMLFAKVTSIAVNILRKLPNKKSFLTDI
ncbi:MAG TPA: hypothetical protein VK138_15165 [Acidiferrobacterales bacterium]|nr:hypothetical protein [Acidiferrobacterales bacterium]